MAKRTKQRAKKRVEAAEKLRLDPANDSRVDAERSKPLPWCKDEEEGRKRRGRKRHFLPKWLLSKKGLVRILRKKRTEEPRNSAFQGTYGSYALLREMPYRQYIELKEKVSRNLEFMFL